MALKMQFTDFFPRPCGFVERTQGRSSDILKPKQGPHEDPVFFFLSNQKNESKWGKKGSSMFYMTFYFSLAHTDYYVMQTGNLESRCFQDF